MIKKVYKLIDRSLILAIELENTDTIITIKSPLNVTQSMNPQTHQPEIVLLPMDLIFSEVESSKDSVSIKKEHIMWEKPLKDFPSYEYAYGMQTTGIETVKTSGIIS